MAATDVVFSGLYFAVGYTATVWVAGLDCGDYVVSAEGTVTAPINSDPDGNFNGAYLAQFDVGPYDRTTYGDATTRLDIATGTGAIQTIFVPVVIGFTYPSYGIVLPPQGQDQGKTTQGPMLGDTRRHHWIAAQLRNAQGVTFGTDNGNWDFNPLKDEAGNVLLRNELYTGIWSKPLDDNPSLTGAIGWNVTRPYPCSVVSVSGHVETSER